MFAKGNLHTSGPKLIAYIMAANKEGERVEFGGADGFEFFSPDLIEAARLMQRMADVTTNAEKPWFHAQTRLPADERLTPEQWDIVRQREGKRLGFEGLPCAWSFHVNEATGERHMHIAWYRVDVEQERAVDPGLFKLRLKELCRTLEKEFALREVSNHRQPHDLARSADRDEVEESRRLGTDVRAIRTTILDCLERSDGGKAFRAALEAKGLMLTNGDRRDCFVVIDQEGGQHALNKKLTGHTLAATRARLSDLDRSQLPGVEQAQAERQRAAAQEARQRAEPQQAAETRVGQERASPAPEKRPLGKTAAQIHAAWTETHNPADLAAGAAAFQQAIEDRGPILVYVSAEEARASERARSFAKAVNRQNRALKEGFAVVDERGTVTRIDQRVTGDLWYEIEQRLAGIDRAGLPTVAEAREAMKDANRSAWAEAREQARPASRTEATIAEALKETMTGTEFAAELDDKGLTVARVTAADMQALEALREQDRRAGTFDELASGRRFAAVTAGELAAVTRQGDVLRLSPHKLDFEEIEQRLADVQTRLPSVAEARALNEQTRERQAEQRAQNQADFIAAKIEHTDAFAGKQELRQAVRGAEHAVHETFETPAAAVASTARKTGKALRIAEKIFETGFNLLFGWATAEPKLTPQQVHDKAQARGNEETLHAEAVAAELQAKETAHDWAMHAQKTAQQEQDLSLSARFGTPPTREANIGRERDDDCGRERERD